MKKKHHKKNKETIQPKENIQELSASRDGGQVALRGYSYQFLYSCYLILASNDSDIFYQLEMALKISITSGKMAEPKASHIYS